MIDDVITNFKPIPTHPLSDSSLAIRFECPECGKTLSVQDQLAGKKVKCPCGAVVVANSSAAPAAPQRPVAPVQRPATAPAQRPGAAAAQSKPVATTRPAAPVARGPAPTSDLADLFDELTPTDLETRAQRNEAAANAPVKVDPLAAYRPPEKGRGARASSGPKIDRPTGLSVLVGFAVLGIIGAIGGAAVALASPDTLQRGPAPIHPNVIKLTGGLLIGTAVVSAVLVAALLTPKPWAWWYAILFYSSNIWVNLANAFFVGQNANAAVGAGRAVGALIVGAIILAYLYKQSTRDFFAVKVPGWVGPAVSIPGGLAIGFAGVMGVGAAVLAVSG